LIPAVADLVAAARSTRRSGAPVPTLTLLRAEVRGTLAALYWLGRTVSRYYSWPALLAGGALRHRALGRWLAGTAGLGLAATALTDYVRKRPRLDPVRFVLAHLLDDLANNAGLLVGCLRHRTLRPLLVELRLYFPRSRSE